jgi:hypothetical protein
VDLIISPGVPVFKFPVFQLDDLPDPVLWMNNPLADLKH